MRPFRFGQCSAYAACAVMETTSLAKCKNAVRTSAWPERPSSALTWTWRATRTSSSTLALPPAYGESRQALSNIGYVASWMLPFLRNRFTISSFNCMLDVYSYDSWFVNPKPKTLNCIWVQCAGSAFLQKSMETNRRKWVSTNTHRKFVLFLQKYSESSGSLWENII